MFWCVLLSLSCQIYKEQLFDYRTAAQLAKGQEFWELSWLPVKTEAVGNENSCVFCFRFTMVTRRYLPVHLVWLLPLQYQRYSSTLTTLGKEVGGGVSLQTVLSRLVFVCVCELFSSDGWLNKHLIVQLQRQHDGSDFTCVCVCVNCSVQMDG